VLHTFLLEDVVFDDILELDVFDDILALVVLGIGFELVVEMTFRVDNFVVNFELVDFDDFFELLDFDVALSVLEDEVFFAEDDGFDDELALDELALEAELLLLVDGEERELPRVEVELDVREDRTLELIGDTERLELEVAVEEDKLELMFLVDDAVELLLGEAEVLFDVDSVVGEETCKVGQRDGGYRPVSSVVTATDTVLS
jgi:hypothetical protein